MMGDIDKISQTTPLAIALERLLGQVDPDGTKRATHTKASLLQQAWEQSAGQQVADITRGLALRRTELFVTVENPVWAQELNLLAEDYRVRLNETLSETGENLITSITFRVAR